MASELEIVRHFLFEPEAQSLTNTPLLSNSAVDRSQKIEFAKVELDLDEVAVITNGLSLGTWEKCITFDQNLAGFSLKVTQSMRSLDATPRQNTDFQLHLLSQTKRGGNKLDFTLIFVVLVPQDRYRGNRYLFFPFGGDLWKGDVYSYEPVSVNVFREFHIFVMQTSGRNKYNPTLSNIITSFKSFCSAMNPVCMSSPACQELRQFLNTQITIAGLASNNLCIQDVVGTRFNVPLAPMAVKSKLIARRVQEANSSPEFRWSDYTNINPMVIEVPFYATQNAIRIVHEMAAFGRTNEVMMQQPSTDFVTALQLSVFLEMDQISQALSYLATLSIMFSSHLMPPAELINLLKGVLNSMDGKRWVTRMSIQSTGATKAQGPMLASLLLGFIGSYEGLEAASDMIFSPELKDNVVQSVHFMIYGRH